MSKTNWLSLGDCCTFENGDRGNNYPSKTDFCDSGVPFLNGGNIVDNRLTGNDYDYISYQKFKSLRAGKVQEGDLLFCLRGSIGKCAISNLEVAAIASSLVIIRCLPNLLPQYLYYVLISSYFQKSIANSDNGSVQGNISVAYLSTMKVPVPSLSVQRHIVGVLSSIDNKIENNRKLMTELEDTARLVYEEWFCRFDFPDAQGRPYRSSGGRMIWSGKLKREIPEGWDISAVADLVKYERGYSYSSNDLSDDGYPMISLASIDRKHHYRPEELKHLRQAPIEKDLAKPGEMLLACTDLTRLAEIIGCPIKVPHGLGCPAFSMDLARLDVSSDKIDDWYLYMTLRTDAYHEFIKQFASGTNVLHLNLDGLKWFQIPVPIRSIQDRFGELAETLWSRGDEAMRESQQLASLRNCLLPMLINGQATIE